MRWLELDKDRLGPMLFTFLFEAFEPKLGRVCCFGMTLQKGLPFR